MDKARIMSRDDVNTGRQFEFDLGKALCLFAMIFCHCLEMLPISESVLNSSFYYTIVVVLDALFGATLFMQCMGVGLAYSKNNKPTKIMLRGLIILLSGFLLHFLRDGLPCWIGVGLNAGGYVMGDVFISVFCSDIMPFAGLALIFFGFFKLIKLKDWMIFVIALGLSLGGTFIELVYNNNYVAATLLGLFVKTRSPNPMLYYAQSCFNFFNWFILVVLSYLYGKFLRKVNNKEKYYLIATIVTGVLTIVYLGYHISHRAGLMNDDIYKYYYAMPTQYVPVVFITFIFDSCLCHYISKLFNEKTKKFITGISVNINIIYWIQWLIICWLTYILEFVEVEGIEAWLICIIAVITFVFAIFFSPVVQKIKKAIVNKIKKPKQVQSEN